MLVIRNSIVDLYIFQAMKQTQNINSQSDTFTLLCRTQLHEEVKKEYRFHPKRRWRFDYAIPRRKIAIEVEGGIWTGGRHVSPKGFLGDMEKYNTATTLGWHILRTIPQELCTSQTLEMIKDVIDYLEKR